MCFNYSEGKHSRWKKIEDWFENQVIQVEERNHEAALRNVREIFLGEGQIFLEAENIFMEALGSVYPEITQFRTNFQNAFAFSRYKKHRIKTHENEIKNNKKVYAEMYKALSKWEKTEENKDFKKLLVKWVINDAIGSVPDYLVIITNPKDWASIYKVPKFESVRYALGNAKSTFILRKQTEELNIRKLIQSCIPHCIHNMDSRAMIRCCNTLIDEGIPVYAAHDCFNVHPRHAKRAKEAYFQAFIQITLIENPIEEFFKFNNISLKTDARKIFDNYLLKKKAILDDFKQGKIVMNKYILN